MLEANLLLTSKFTSRRRRRITSRRRRRIKEQLVERNRNTASQLLVLLKMKICASLLHLLLDSRLNLYPIGFLLAKLTLKT